MSQKFEKLKTLLKELFQLDQPDLDFGFYRVMHARSAEVTQFLEKDMLPQVKAAFGECKTADVAEILGVAQNTLRKWAARGEIPMHRNPANGYRLLAAQSAPWTR